MIRIFTIKTKDEATATAFLSMFATLIALAGNDKIEFSEEYKRERKTDTKPVGNAGPRVHYVAKLADGLTPEERERVIANNLSLLGSGKIQALVYQDIIAANQSGTKITKNDVRKSRSMAASSAERVLGDLCRMGIVESRDINFGEGA